MNFNNTIKKIRACDSEATAQLLLEQLLYDMANKYLRRRLL